MIMYREERITPKLAARMEFMDYMTRLFEEASWIGFDGLTEKDKEKILKQAAKEFLKLNDRWKLYYEWPFVQKYLK
jgi:hypothetical protein